MGLPPLTPPTPGWAFRTIRLCLPPLPPPSLPPHTLPPPPHTHTLTHDQDFEALTPNLLARTIETVEGGGLVVLLLSNLNSLTQLYKLTMDVHSRLRTESHQVGGGGGAGG